MHEMSLVVKLLQLVDQHTQQHQCSTVKQISVELGTLMAVDKAAFMNCFNVAKVHSSAIDAQLEMIDIVAKAHCEHCQQEFSLEYRYTQCPTCGDYAQQIIQGDQMCLVEMEVI